MFVVVELCNSREEGKKRRMIVNNIKIYHICTGRGYNDVLKAVE
jgi:hypothetical protein